MRSCHRTIGTLLIASIALAWGTAPETPPTIFYLESGEEVQAKPSAINGIILVVEAYGRERKLPLSQIVAVKTGGELSNGPFDGPRLREIFGLPAPIVTPAPVRSLHRTDTAGATLSEPSGSGPGTETVPAAAAAGPSGSADSGESHYGPEYIVYGQVVHSSFAFGPPGQFGTPSSTMTKVFTRCVTKDGKENCGQACWIGLLGEDLSSALGEVPEARAIADRIKTTTTIQALSLVATPVFLFSAVSTANGPRDDYGKVHTHIGPAAFICFTLTGVAFANYAGWNIYEGYLARKAIRVYNEKMRIKVSAGPAPDGAAFAAEIRF